MASWGRVASLFRGLLRSPRSIKALGLRRVVGPGVLGSLVGAGVVCYYQYFQSSRTLPCSVYAKEEEQKDALGSNLSARRLRFIQFASVVYQGEPYMTPRDFLYSVMLENVDRKLQKRILTEQEVQKMLTAASKARAGDSLFRSLGDNGLISYTEYLFLLTILTKPRTGFHIAFKMLDVDGNEHVDKKEFLKLKKIIAKSRKVPRPVAKENVESPAEEVVVNTTLQVHFFGQKGQNKLQYQDFHRFMENLQAEVQEMEFLQFSKGMDTMRREDFAEWLLHYTNEEDNEVYWQNMRKKIPAGQSITFEEFRAFCLFTNNLEDFAVSMKMVTEANRPVGMAQFKRAVRIATGHDLSDNVLDTVFKLFDMDGDNCLSHKEFINVMTDRVLRGLKVQPQTGISGYWKCVKRETLKGAKEALTDRCPI
ncbi:calcium uptake protein 2, mitochondrial [Boleophthalmus pectinirostris]|uniref:calcium uptake protein 2, mitochondrial n=1 Tax=Boleophthalmus pectinirostris TaxID=150288 RepID=UPI000A1C610F|nr:calcium uptake protein 2, mitochondrial [Boleophthalmus pectinirostris]